MEALTDTPVVFLRGARQTGKTTLVRLLSEVASADAVSRHYISLDSATALASAQDDTKGLVSLRNSLGEHFVRGVVVYTGHEVIPMSDRIFAVPIGMVY